ncbi:MAG: hypothetical protein OK441_04855 [Thaumarchaeota archaeon]|nr:hypothetical protein [Nitrososphaerota archaeon]
MTDPKTNSFTWKETGKLESQLEAGGEFVGAIRWDRGWGTLATGESTEGRWTFKRVGLLTPKIVVRASGSQTNSATLTTAWRGGGVIDLPTGESFRLGPKGFWRSEWVLTGSDQRPLMTMKPSFAWGKAGASVEVEPAALSVHEFSLLVVLSWYSVLLVSYDNSDGDGSIIASLVATGTI